MKTIKRPYKNIYLAYTLFFLVIWGVIMLPFALRGNSLIGESDGFNQSFPVFIYIGDYIRGLFQGEWKVFDFCIGLGDDVITALNWHGFGDVFQVISALFPHQYAEIGYELVMLMKYYSCGIAFLLFCNNYVEDNGLKIAGAIMYTFSAFALFWGLNCWMFLNPMFTLPLILYGVDQIWTRKGSIQWIYIVAIFIQSLNGFYFLYMEIIVTILYFTIITIIRLMDHHITVRGAIYVALRALLQGILGCMLGACILLPAVLGFLSSSRADDASLFDGLKSLFIFDNTEYYLRGIANLLIPEAYESTITLPLIAVLGLILLITRNVIQKEIKIMTVVMICAFWIPAIGKMMNGFSYWVDRWYYAVIMFVILVTIMEMERICTINIKEIVIWSILAGISVIFNFCMSNRSIGVVLRCGMALALIAILPVLWNTVKVRKRLLMIYSIFVVVINGLLVFGPTKLGGSGYSAGFIKKGEAYTQIAESVQNISKDNDRFERWDIYESSLASSLVMNYNGTVEYFSMLNSNVSDFYRALSISPGVRSAKWILKGLDGRQELESLLAVSTYMDRGLENNQYPISLAFCVDEAISEKEFLKLSPLQKESVLLNFAILEDDVETTLSKGMDIIGTDELVSTRLQDMEGRIRIYIKDPIQESGEYYVRLNDMILKSQGTCDVEVANKNIQLRNQNDNYYMGETEFWVHISDFQKKEDEWYFDIVLDETKEFLVGEIEVYFHKPDYDAIVERQKSAIDTVQVRNDHIEGMVTVKDNEYMVLTVPYSKGWVAYVDGVKTPIYKADIAFMAIKPGNGVHRIEFCYTTPGLKVGIIISLLGVAVVIILLVRQQKKKRLYGECKRI